MNQNPCHNGLPGVAAPGDDPVRVSPVESRAIDRRMFLQTTTAAAVTTWAALQAQAAPADPELLVDTNVSIGQWPFRQEPLSDTPALVRKLREWNVTSAWAGSLDALLHKDLSSVNARLADECRRHGPGLLVPIGAVNPLLPGWEEDFRRCVDVHQMPGIRLHPNYHGYTLQDPLFERVLQLATQRKILVQISVIMEDERTIHPLVNVPATDTAPLLTLLPKYPQVRLQLLNAFRTLRGEPVLTLAAAGARFEVAMLEGVAGIANLLEKLPLDRLCFGSHAPLFYFESAHLKLQESLLGDVQRKAVCAGNAQRLLVPA
jgi:uncharacterized protein